MFIQATGKQMHSSTPYHTFRDIINKYNATVENYKNKLPLITLHGLRHTSAALLITQNLDYQTVSERLGHAQRSTTLNIYSHSWRKMDQKVAEVLENSEAIPLALTVLL